MKKREDKLRGEEEGKRREEDKQRRKDKKGQWMCGAHAWRSGVFYSLKLIFWRRDVANIIIHEELKKV